MHIHTLRNGATATWRSVLFTKPRATDSLWLCVCMFACGGSGRNTFDRVHFFFSSWQLSKRGPIAVKCVTWHTRERKDTSKLCTFQLDLTNTSNRLRKGALSCDILYWNNPYAAFMWMSIVVKSRWNNLPLTLQSRDRRSPGVWSNAAKYQSDPAWRAPHQLGCHKTIQHKCSNDFPLFTHL